MSHTIAYVAFEVRLHARDGELGSDLEELRRRVERAIKDSVHPNRQLEDDVHVELEESAGGQ